MEWDTEETVMDLKPTFHGPTPKPSRTGQLPLSTDRFLRCLIDSQLLPIEEVQALRARLPKNQHTDIRALAAELVRRGQLTEYQATLLCQGRTRGLVLGNYVLLDRLGAGGMGTVYRARHRRLQGVIALKVLPPTILRSIPTALARFQQEARAAARLHHPNIVSVLDADKFGDVHFLVMEYIAGTDLAQLVRRRGPLSVTAAVDCVVQAARGLGCAHAAGIIHRDVKPANLLVDHRGVVRVLDLGLARMEPGPAGTDRIEEGKLVGTKEYMAPEQAADPRCADARSDVYGLGCTLYYLLTGEHLYGDGTPTETLRAHRDQAIPSLRARCREVSEGLEAVYERMVAKDPSDRYPGMAEFINDAMAVAKAAVVLQRLPKQDLGCSTVQTIVEPTARTTVADASQLRRPGK